MSIPTLVQRTIPHTLKAINTKAPPNTLLIRINPGDKPYFSPLSVQFEKTFYFNFSDTERVNKQGAIIGTHLNALALLLIDCYKSGTSIVVMSHSNGALANAVVRVGATLGFETEPCEGPVSKTMNVRLKNAIVSFTKGARQTSLAYNERAPHYLRAHGVLEEKALTSA